MSNLNNYQTPMNTFYTPPPHQPQTYYNNPTNVLQSTQNSPQNQHPSQTGFQSNEGFQQFVVDRLTSMDNRLSKLDSIEQQISVITSKMTSLDTRVTFLEATARESDSKMNDIEKSKAFDSQICDELQKKNSELEKALKEERSRIASLNKDLSALKSVSEDVTDLQSRSMRDNLLFFGFEEGKTPDDRRTENCTKLILDFLSNSLKIPEAHVAIKIERAHRLGYKYEIGKSRPIVVKFNHYPDKLLVKQLSHEFNQSFGKGKSDENSTGENNSTNNSYHVQRPKIRVSEQYPKIIQDRRKMLIPTLIKAKEDGKKAYLSYDKLYINNKMFTTENVSSAGYN
ncbi:uncharacterized protein LOC132741129 [Ruditapes philippinarum]|uniref:uncharacterized protein LOC132741129 n=1 Tax=Ruditapes philippinarum TaxID=129788 RepID=UPI00295C1B8B|nr:uncharacterized protein LOC132741129 [Ruditapes philippinarum]